MENFTNSDKLERLATGEEREYVQRLLGNVGLVDALLCDQPETQEHPEDRQWAVELDYNPCIELGID